MVPWVPSVPQVPKVLVLTVRRDCYARNTLQVRADSSQLQCRSKFDQLSNGVRLTVPDLHQQQTPGCEMLFDGREYAANAIQTVWAGCQRSPGLEVDFRRE